MELHLSHDDYASVRYPFRWRGRPLFDLDFVMRRVGDFEGYGEETAHCALGGTVLDGEGQPIPGVQITFEEPTGSGSRSLTTNRKGKWEAVLLSAPLLYPFQFSKAGFETLVLDLQLRRPAHPQLMTSAAYEIVLPAEGTGTPGARKQGFEASYRRGVEALERDDLPVAGTELLAAILAQPVPGAMVQFSATRVEPYLPYLRLGTVDLYLGRSTRTLSRLSAARSTTVP